MIAFAWFMIMMTPLITAFFFARFPLAFALPLTLICGHLFLPPDIGINLPALPTLDKTTLPLISAAIFAYAASRGKGWKPPRDQDWGQNGWLPQSWTGRLLFLGLLAYPICTVMTNRDRLGEPHFINGLSYYDIGSLTYDSMFILLAITLGRRFLSHDEGQRYMISALAVCAVIYSVPVIIEWRLSPFLSDFIYGFQPYQWNTLVRFGGFRPVVFQEGGLRNAAVVTLLMLATVAAIRHFTGGRKQVWQLAAIPVVGAWLFSYSLTAWLLGAGFGLLLAFGTMRQHRIVIMTVISLVAIYPLTQLTGQFPDDLVLNAIRAVHETRADSLEFRWSSETQIMERVYPRQYFGYGPWGRAFPYHPIRNTPVTVDSFWIITWMRFGWLGYFSMFGLLFVPPLMLVLRQRRTKPSWASLGLCIVLCAVLLDQMVNATVTPTTWLIAGAVLGRAERGLRASRVPRGSGAHGLSGTPAEDAGPPALGIRGSTGVMQRAPRQKTGGRHVPMIEGARARARASLGEGEGG